MKMVKEGRTLLYILFPDWLCPTWNSFSKLGFDEVEKEVLNIDTLNLAFAATHLCRLPWSLCSLDSPDPSRRGRVNLRGRRGCQGRRQEV